MSCSTVVDVRVPSPIPLFVVNAFADSKLRCSTSEFAKRVAGLASGDDMSEVEGVTTSIRKDTSRSAAIMWRSSSRGAPP